MDSPSPSKAPSRCVTPHTDRGSPSQQSNPFDSPKSSRISRIKQSLKDNWAAGTDPKHFHEKRRQRTPDYYSDNSTSNSRSSSRQRPRTEAPSPDPIPRSGPSRAATHRPAPTSHPSILSQNVSQRAKDKRRHEKTLRKLERDASLRLKIKHHREFERGDFSSVDGTGSPLHAPLHMLAEANEARHRADEKRKRYYEWERRRSEVERRRAYAPVGAQPPPDRDDALVRTAEERAQPQLREPEYGKDPDERPSPAPALSPRQTKHGNASATENTYQPPVADSDDPFEESSSDEQIMDIINAYSHRWTLQPPTPSPSPTHNPYAEPEAEDEEGDSYLQHRPNLQPPTPSPVHQSLTEPEEEENSYFQHWSNPPHRAEPGDKEEEEEIPSPQCRLNPHPSPSPSPSTSIINTYFQRWSRTPSPAPHPHPSPSRPPSRRSPAQPAPNPSRGEFEGIIHKLTMPDQEASRRERDTYHAHVTRRLRDAAGKEYF
ncbi:MAG: hypothetical protein Q9195_007121 [Heterodermia aff. obscurata]